MTITESLRHLYFDDYEYTRLVDLTSQPRLQLQKLSQLVLTGLIDFAPYFLIYET